MKIRKFLCSHECTPLRGELLEVVAAPAHPLARARRRATLPQLAGQRWALNHRGSRTRLAFERAFVDAGLIPPRPAIESRSIFTNMHLVARSRLLTLAPSSAALEYARLGLVKAVRTEFAFAPGMLGFVALREHRQLPALMLLREAMLEAGA